MIDITENEFKELAGFIKNCCGINMTKKKMLITGRLQQILVQNNFKNFSEYYDYLTSDTCGEAIATLIDKLTTNHTFFMREMQHFEYFKNMVLPNLLNNKSGIKDLRIWSAGCSSGEEPYTLAMIIDDVISSIELLCSVAPCARD